MAEKHKDEIVLHNIDSYAVQLLIEYSYTGDVKITEENVQVCVDRCRPIECSRSFKYTHEVLMCELFWHRPCSECR